MRGGWKVKNGGELGELKRKWWDGWGVGFGRVKYELELGGEGFDGVGEGK